MLKEIKIQDMGTRTYNFAMATIKLVNEFPKTTAAFILGRQLIRAGTSVNSNIIHAKASLTKKEYTNYFNNAKRKAKETKSWLLMTFDSGLIRIERMKNLIDENEKIIKILVKSVKTLQNIK